MAEQPLPYSREASAAQAGVSFRLEVHQAEVTAHALKLANHDVRAGIDFQDDRSQPLGVQMRKQVMKGTGTCPSHTARDGNSSLSVQNTVSLLFFW